MPRKRLRSAGNSEGIPQVCGCTSDAECGGANSGFICEGSPAVCVPGCRPNGVGGTCPVGQNCAPAQGGGNTGTCVLGCAGNGDCQQPIPVCDPNSNNCVQCVTSVDCAGNLVCTPQKTCGECSPTDTTNCDPNGTGGICRPNGQCGCNTDADCGGPTSGRVCDDTSKVCRAGCRGTGGNGCTPGNLCTSTTNAIGQCVVDPGDAGADAGADAGTDAGADAGLDAGRPDSGVGPGVPDAATDGGDGGSEPDSFSIEGGGCACSVLGAESPTLSLGALGAAGAAALAFARRRRRRT